MPKGLLILSGGMDSTTLCYDLHHQGIDLHCLSFDYGQKHKKELQFAELTCHKLNIPHRIIPFTEDLKRLICNSALTDPYHPVPEGHYEDPTMKQTVVPNRNMIMLALAAGYAISNDIQHLYYACHAGDHAIYPDCRPEFVKAMVRAFNLCHYDGGILLHAPYLMEDKGTICKIGTALNVPYEDAWTCYKGEDKPCGLCGACQERKEAFAFAGRPDPLQEA